MGDSSVDPDEIDALIQQLFNDATWEAAAEALVAAGAEVVPEIARRFTSEAAKTQQRLAIVLGRIRSESGIPVLAEALQESGTAIKVRVAAIRALGKIGGVESLDLVSEFKICPKKPDVQHAAKEVAAQLENQLKDVMEQASAADADTREPELERWAPLELQRTTYSLDDLNADRVVEIVHEILKWRRMVSRYDLVTMVSKRFGRNYLIRVRQFVNRYIYPASARGELRIQDDMVIA